MMSNKSIEEFGRILVAEVRDRAVHDCDHNRDPGRHSAIGKRWQSKGIGPDSECAKVVAPDCIDYAIYYLLDAIDNGTLHLQLKTTEGDIVDLTSDGMGELAGWYIGPSEGWRGKYSSERYSEFVAPE